MKEREGIILDFLKLRILVAFLGEKNQYNWWETNILNETGEKFLSFSFPRSKFLASIIIITEAAKQLHDEKVGKGRIYHLFRLPYNLEEKIFCHLKDNSRTAYKKILLDKKTALTFLEKMTREKINAPEGPVQIGTLNKIENENAIEEIAKHYLSAFESNTQIFPYFKG